MDVTRLLPALTPKRAPYATQFGVKTLPGQFFLTCRCSHPPPRSQIQKKYPEGCFHLYGGGPGITRNHPLTVSARWALPLCGSVPKAPRVAWGRTRRTSKPNPKRIHKKTAQKGGSFIDGGGPGIRTPGTSRFNGFQDRRFRPLSQPT